MTDIKKINEALAAASEPVSEPEQPSERVEQDCGCEYGKPRCPKNCRLVAILAASAPTLTEQQWPSDRDAAVTSCALMILCICKTEPQEVWPKRIKERIRYMLSKLQPQEAEPTRNQCDGCAVGAPFTERGNHEMPDGGYMGCTASRYSEPKGLTGGQILDVAEDEDDD